MSLNQPQQPTNENTAQLNHSRDAFFDKVQNLISNAETGKEKIIFIRVGIDDFRYVNEEFGFAIGDGVLIEIDHRLNQRLTKGCGLCLGYGEYALALWHDNNIAIQDALAEIYSTLIAEFHIEGHSIHLKYSLGVAHYPGDKNTPAELMLAAESAKQQARNKGGGQIHYFTDELYQEALSRKQLKKELIHAINQKEFFLVYQPKVDATSGIVKGFEALLRWQHPQRGLVSPVEFISVLEESGLIIEVGDWVINEVCRAIIRWRQVGVEVVPVSVNVSTQQFKQTDFVDRLKAILTTEGIEPQLLEIEITESCLMENVEYNVQLLNNIKQLGILISIDDFGTGYSSLSYLQRLPIDTLKIDRSFVTNVDNRQANDNAGIVTAIMALSHSLRLNVVAEGVESARELAFLHALGCRTIQGFLFSKPLQEAAVLDVLKESACMQETLEKVRQELRN